MMQTLPSMLPTGWFQVAWSADLAVADVFPMHYFGRDLVAFRQLDGAVKVLDAHCQHLGASLAHGGCVVEDGIQCPFHGWVWNGAGRNVRIPYQDRPNKGRRVRSYPVAELNDSILIWHDSAGGDPLWEAPDGFAVLGDHVQAQRWRGAVVQLCQQVLSLCEQVPSAAGEQLTGRGELDVAPVPDEQLEAQPGLQLGDLRGQCLLGDLQAGGGTGEVQLVREDDRVAHQPQVQVHGRQG